MKVLFSLSVKKLYDLVRRKQVNSWSPAVHYHVDWRAILCLLVAFRVIRYGQNRRPLYVK